MKFYSEDEYHKLLIERKIAGCLLAISQGSILYIFSILFFYMLRDTFMFLIMLSGWLIFDGVFGIISMVVEEYKEKTIKVSVKGKTRQGMSASSLSLSKIFWGGGKK